jgi:HK97 family phage portal protein
MPLWGRKREQTASPTPDEERFTLSDPAAAYYLGGTVNISGESVGEGSMLSLSAVYRAVSLISQAAGTLPLKSYRDVDGERKRESSFLDNPAGTDALMTPFQWKEQVFLHLLIHGEADLYHVRNEAGALVGLQPIHPSAVAVYADENTRGGEYYTVSLDSGRNVRLTPYGKTREDPGMTRIVGPRTRGLRGWSPLTKGATSFGIGLAAEKATANLFRKGALVQGAIVPEAGEDVSKEDAKAIRLDLDQHLYGADNAGKMPLINRALKFVGWQMNNVDAQFLENRQFQIEEIARWFGVPPFLLMQLEKQTSWGTGLAETNRNFAQYVLLPWCKRIEERLSVLLPQPRWCEFDMAGLEAGSAKEEITLLMQQVNGGFMFLNEARKVRNLPPVDGGDLLRIPSGVMLQEQLEASAAATVAATEGTENQQEGESGGAQVTA